jgi:hypothetical protein
MADVSSTSSGGADAQAQAAQLRSEHERRLATLKQSLRAEEEKIRSSGAAAIVHLRESTEDAVAREKADGQRRIQQTTQEQDRLYQDMKRRAGFRVEELGQRVERSETESQRKIEGHRSQVRQVAEATQQQLRELMKAQEQRRSQIERQARDENQATTERLQRQSQETIKKVEADNQESLVAEMSQGEREIANLKTALARERDQVKAQIQDARMQGQQTLGRETSDSSRRLRDLEMALKAAEAKQQRDHISALEVLRRQNDSQIKAEVSRGARVQETVQENSGREVQRTQQIGDMAVSRERLKYQELLKKQAEDHDQETRRLREVFTQREATLREDFDQRLQRLDTTQRANLSNAEAEFQKRYQQQELTHRDSLTNQRQTFLKALYQERKQFNESMARVQEQKGDPFYANYDFGAKLDEMESHYVLSGRTAPHEVDKLEVRVQGDRVSISAARAHNESFEESGVKLATNTAQTVRQEFRLDRPADPKGVVRQIEPDGQFRVLIPKKGFNPIG